MSELSREDDVHKIMLTFDERVRKLESLVNSIKIQRNPNEIGTRLDTDFQKLMDRLSQVNRNREIIIQDHSYDFEHKKEPKVVSTSTSSHPQNISPIPTSKSVNNIDSAIPSFQKTQEPEVGDNSDEEVEGESEEDDGDDDEWTLRARRLWSPKRREKTVSPPNRRERKAQRKKEMPPRPFDFAKEVREVEVSKNEIPASKILSSNAPIVPKGWVLDDDGKRKVHYLQQRRFKEKKKKRRKRGKGNNSQMRYYKGKKKSHSFSTSRNKRSQWRKIVSPTKPLPLGLYAAKTVCFEAKRGMDNFKDDGRSKKLLLTNIFKDEERDRDIERKRIISRMRRKKKKRFVSYSSVRHLAGDHSKMDNVDYYLNLCSTKYSKNKADQEKKIFVRWAGQRTRKDDRMLE